MLSPLERFFKPAFDLIFLTGRLNSLFSSPSNSVVPPGEYSGRPRSVTVPNPGHMCRRPTFIERQRQIQMHTQMCWPTTTNFHWFKLSPIRCRLYWNFICQRNLSRSEISLYFVHSKNTGACQLFHKVFKVFKRWYKSFATSLKLEIYFIVS